MKQVHKFEKALANNGFVISNIFEKSFCGKGYKEYVYKNPAYQGRVIVVIWPNGDVDNALHYFIQSNGITAPSICETGPQLDRNLKRHYENKD